MQTNLCHSIKYKNHYKYEQKEEKSTLKCKKEGGHRQMQEQR